MTDTLPAPLDVRLMNQTASVLFMACVVLVLAASVWWALRHPAFAIGRIVVEGDLVHNNAVTLRANVAPQLVGNFFTIDLRTAREAFEQAPWVRSAQVRRQYPRTLHVVLQEHNAVAHWGPDTGLAMVNSYGEVFEASADDAEDDDLPRLQGPQGQSAQVLQMYGLLQSAFGTLGMPVKALELSGRGGWRATLGGGADVQTYHHIFVFSCHIRVCLLLSVPLSGALPQRPAPPSSRHAGAPHNHPRGANRPIPARRVCAHTARPPA